MKNNILLVPVVAPASEIVIHYGEKLEPGTQTVVNFRFGKEDLNGIKIVAVQVSISLERRRSEQKPRELVTEFLQHTVKIHSSQRDQ